MDIGLDSLNIASKKAVHKAGGFLGHKTVDALTKSNDDNTEKQKSVEEIIIPQYIICWDIVKVIL